MFVLPASDRKWETGGKQSEEPAAGVEVGVDSLGLEVDIEGRDVLLDESVQLVHTQPQLRHARLEHLPHPVVLHDLHQHCKTLLLRHLELAIFTIFHISESSKS